MTKNICIFSDGTGQAGGANPINWTNVYRLFVATRDIDNQVCFYDPGLGANPDEAVRPSAFAKIVDVLSLATGYGITTNIIDCYTALMLCYEPGDRIFLFGFSRGAYTIRSLGGAIGLCGIPKGFGGVSRWDGFQGRLKGDARTIAKKAITEVYQERDARKRSTLAEAFRRTHVCDKAPPYFIGVWDTVRALGIKGISDLLPARHHFNDDFLNKAVPYGRQALSIDENRDTFKPEIWDERGAPAEQIKQRWFSGVHTDVGGGYGLKMGLSDLTLDWMAREALACREPLKIDPSLLASLKPDALGLQHDERRTGMVPWQCGTREGAVASPYFAGRETVVEDKVVERFAAKSVPVLDGTAIYRPRALRNHPDFQGYY